MAGPTTGGEIKVNETPEQLRRKTQLLKQELRLLDAYVKGLPAYGGVWRTDQGAALPVPVTTAWSVIPGFTEDRPSIPKKVNVDFPTGLIGLTETGVYEVGVSLVFQGQVGRIVGVGVRTNGVDPLTAAVDLEIPANNRDVLLTYVTSLSIIDIPADFHLVWQVDGNTTLDFSIGGWSIARLDYNSPLMTNQRIMG